MRSRGARRLCLSADGALGPAGASWRRRSRHERTHETLNNREEAIRNRWRVAEAVARRPDTGAQPSNGHRHPGEVREPRCDVVHALAVVLPQELAGGRGLGEITGKFAEVSVELVRLVPALPSDDVAVAVDVSELVMARSAG